MDVVLGLDVGTTSTKAVSVSAEGRLRGTSSTGYPLSVPRPGWAELDPAAVVRAARLALADEATAARERGDAVRAVVVSAAMHGLLPLGKDGSPLGPLSTWADARASDQARALVEDGRAAALHARTGTPVHPMSPVVRLAWWRQHDAELLRSAPRWGGVKELVLAALLDGAPHVVDASCASASGLLDLRRGSWDPEAMEVAGVRADQLGRLVPTTEVLGPASGDLGLPPGTPVVAGASDGVLANLGSGAVADGVAAVSLGTSGAVRAVRREPGVDAGGRLFCYALTEGRWVLGGAVNNGGSVVRYLGGLLRPAEVAAARGDDDALDALDAVVVEEASRVPAGARGLLCLPYLLGERAPWWRPGLTGAYLGLRRDHGPADLVRAGVEGVCLQLSLVLAALRDADVRVDVVRATGGAVASPLWSRVLAGALDVPVELADSPEGTAAGAALLGHHVLGALPDLDAAADLVPVTARVEPDGDDVEAYARLRPLLERAVAGVADVLADLGAAGGTEETP